jgi:carbamoyltransferase
LVYTLQSEYLANKKLPPYFAGHSKEDLAAAFQRRLEEVATDFVANAMQVTGQKKLVLAGGVVANVKMNQRIADLPGVESIFVHPGMGDDGISLGAAFYTMAKIRRQEGKAFRPPRLEHVYLGPEYSAAEIESELRKSGLNYRRSDQVEVEIAKYLAEGKVVARFNGAMEYGPRALGNRSILYSPVDRSVNDWLNKRLSRTEFMPFAPSTLAEYAGQCYEDADMVAHACQFMTITLNCTEWMKEHCPAVVHVDGTARPHLVRADLNPSYYRVIDEFRKLTGIPTVVNTSFNMHEEPIVCSPYDAIRAFKLGHLDVLAIGDFLAEQG